MIYLYFRLIDSRQMLSDVLTLSYHPNTHSRLIFDKKSPKGKAIVHALFTLNKSPVIIQVYINVFHQGINGFSKSV